MLNEEEFLKFENVKVCDFEKENLVDISTISIHEQSQNKSFLQYLKQVGNPYCYRCGDVGVKIEFDDTMPYLEPKLIEFLIKKKQG